MDDEYDNAELTRSGKPLADASPADWRRRGASPRGGGGDGDDGGDGGGGGGEPDFGPSPNLYVAGYAHGTPWQDLKARSIAPAPRAIHRLRRSAWRRYCRRTAARLPHRHPILKHYCTTLHATPFL